MAATMDDVLRELQTHTTYLRGGGNSSAQPSMKSAPTFSSGGSQVFDGISGVFGKFKQGADNVLSDWRQSQSNFGIGMNNDAIGLRNSAIMNRMTMQEWGEAINTGRIGFTSLGGTMNDSAKVFSQMSMRFSDTTASDNLAKIGYTTGDYNKLLAITITNNRQLNLQKEQDQQKVIDATEKLGKEMDKVSQLSGISRKEQMDKMEKDRSDMQYQSRLKLMQMEGKGEGVTGLTNIGNQAMMTGTADLVKNIAEGGKLTEKSRDQLQLMGGELSGKYKAAVQEMTNASTAAEREAAEARFKEVNAEVAARLNSKEMLEYSATGANKQVEALREQQLAATNYNDAIQKTMKERNVSEDEARKLLEEKTSLSQEGKEKKESGKIVDIAGAKTTEAMVLAGRRADDAGVKLAQAAQAVNEAGGKNLKKSGVLQDLQNVDEKGVPFSKRVYGQAGDDIIKSINSGTFTKDLLTNLTSAFQQAFKGGTTIAADLINLTGTVVNDGTNPFTAGPEKELTIPPGGSHANGTKESFGDWFGKDFGGGMLAQLHGKEAVVPQDKLTEFINDMQQEIAGKMQNPMDMSSQVTETFNSAVSKLQSSDFEQPFESNTVKQTSQQQPNDEIKPSITGDVTLKDINEQLTKLNTVMIKLVTNTNEMVDNSSKQYRATKQLSPNLNAR